MARAYTLLDKNVLVLDRRSTGSTLAPYGWKLLSAWKRLQVSYYGGRYSIHRVLALETYTKSTSLRHVLLVCLTTPVPMVTLVLAQELVSLQDPKERWSSNYGFWVRTSILVFVGIPTLTVQATYFIDGVKIPTLRLVLLSLVASVGVITGSMAICSHLVFPVSFFLLAMFPVLTVVLVVSFRVIIGTRIIHEILAHRGQLTRYLHFVNAKCLLIFVYPAYEALFRAAHGTQYQVPVILLLPVMKIALKNIMCRCTAHMEDMTPEAVIFTVDLFNSTYMATCMQSASSLMTVTHSLETLFTIECLVVASYLEAVIPLLYASYILVVVHLPSARYHTEMVVVTIVLLLMVVKRNCGVKALHQLAFVLETQMSAIQGKLMFWMLITLCSRLVHFGVDFTFQFAF
ncbi:hypothetical protein PHYSODRAFT_339235 [Phytophthora sojae]|uniref:Uncharacterized protein n=1 Tax=Phytophthora sojae (strain P6497) TaxID=1094619 RepID=G5A646_PHYSP|nr:hypothetical protein PHYSODRAFT_339235 [Phytophthora sojae]EGZ08801.1 hypothetical protein PHYSODRAFT_339235 [Phytophthora sojae]|eukprot:XP_009535434.1 hypothetical protein PHYSODRAFT_339235 [Phytophthora sojae]